LYYNYKKLQYNIFSIITKIQYNIFVLFYYYRKIQYNIFDNTITERYTEDSRQKEKYLQTFSRRICGTREDWKCLYELFFGCSVLCTRWQSTVCTGESTLAIFST